MRTIPLVGWIANAAARFTGTRGAVTQQAQEAAAAARASTTMLER